MAAVLAGGDAAVISHFSAAELWGVLKARRRRPDVTVKRPRRSRLGINFHSSLLAADEVEAHDGIPVTSVARTLLDLAADLDRARLKNVIDKAEGARLSSPASLPALVARYPGRPGTPLIESILADGHIGTNISKEELELRFAAVIEERGLPPPEINVPLFLGDRWIEADCLWRSARLVVELDSRKFHQTDAAFERDRERDRALISEGWRVIRITWRQLHLDPAGVARDLSAALREPIRS